MTVEQPESREPTIFNSLFVLLLVGIFLFVALLYRQDDLSLLAILILVVVGGAKAALTGTSYHFEITTPQTCSAPAAREAVCATPGALAAVVQLSHGRLALMASLIPQGQ